MTVHSGRGWRLAPSLIALEAEANRLAPRRSQASDGSIGDQAHKARASDHNVSGGYVHALDLTHSPSRGFDAHGHGRSIAARRDPRVKYLISNGQIWEPHTGWRTYTGANPHRTHLHVSVHHTAAARTNTSPWLPWATPIPVPVGTPAPQPRPQPTATYHPETPMFVTASGLGLYLIGPGGSFTKFATPARYEAARKSAPTIPTVELTADEARALGVW